MGVDDFLNAVKPHRRVLVDTNVVIYWLEGIAPFGEAAEGLFRLVETGEISGYLSVITATELLVKPIRDNNVDLQEKIGLFLNHFPNLDLIDVTKDIAVKAAQIRATTNLKVPDAILMATAAIRGCALVGNDAACAGRHLDIPYVYLGGLNLRETSR